ncbi:hypothetical protein EW146_g2110 [Bondarzewia mesenterica]|uniref:ornithine decarboxylase n=1 Tax=Bondarzewia mesenterica TaxID=1095465 RepID=A0A4S4M1Q9_9AGAM|nr:hypothetical protein EW146_g2110 [Bondarzewia mesenterica]
MTACIPLCPSTELARNPKTSTVYETFQHEEFSSSSVGTCRDYTSIAIFDVSQRQPTTTQLFVLNSHLLLNSVVVTVGHDAETFCAIITDQKRNDDLRLLTLEWSSVRVTLLRIIAFFTNFHHFTSSPSSPFKPFLAAESEELTSAESNPLATVLSRPVHTQTAAVQFSLDQPSQLSLDELESEHTTTDTPEKFATNMSQVEILPVPFSVDHHLVISPDASYAENLSSWTASTLLLSTPLQTSPNLTERDEAADDNVFFEDLPPVYHGHPDVHLREGIMRAARLAVDHEPDAEKAFFVADLSHVYRQHERWKRCLPEIEPFYAVKCNPDPYILRLLSGLGAGFDCASNGEISQVLKLGIDPGRIIFANPCKATSFIKNAAKAGVDMMTFDNADELYKIARANPRAKLVLRILTDDSKSLCRLGLKFGAPLVTVPGLLAKAKELGLDVIGISFHVGSGCYDSGAFSDAVMRARTTFDMGKQAGYAFKFLDVGGGFEDGNFEATAATLRDAIHRYFPDRHDIRIIAEPGRYYVSRAFSLAANIIARRAPLVDGALEMAAQETDGDQPTVMYYINDGVYGAFNCILFDHQKVQPYVLSLNNSFHIPSSEALRKSSVWGPTCDSIDCVCPVTELPNTLQVGDWLGFDNMGAYTVCAASQFNGFEVSHVIYTTGGGPGCTETRSVLKAVAEAAGKD